MRRLSFVLGTALAAALLGVMPWQGRVTAAAVQTNLLTNGSFEAYSSTLTGWDGFIPSPATGWSTNDSRIEVWNSVGMGTGAAPDGTYISEVNYNFSGILYQDVATTPGSHLRWSIVHRSRSGGAEAINVYLGLGGSTLLTGLNAMRPDARTDLNGTAVSFDNTVTDLVDTSAIPWTRWSGAYTVPAGQYLTRLAVATVYPGGGSGNLIDDVQLVVDAVDYSTSGFRSPLGSGTARIKAGSTVPLKFQVLDGATMVSDLAAVASLEIVPLDSSGRASSDPSIASIRPSSVLRFDVEAQQFIANWQTPKHEGQCFRITGALADGDSFSADVCTV